MPIVLVFSNEGYANLKNNTEEFQESKVLFHVGTIVQSYGIQEGDGITPILWNSQRKSKIEWIFQIKTSSLNWLK